MFLCDSWAPCLNSHNCGEGVSPGISVTSGASQTGRHLVVIYRKGRELMSFTVKTLKFPIKGSRALKS